MVREYQDFVDLGAAIDAGEALDMDRRVESDPKGFLEFWIPWGELLIHQRAGVGAPYYQHTATVLHQMGQAEAALQVYRKNLNFP